MRMGRREEALAYMEDGLAIARELGDKARIEAVLQPLALARLAGGDLRGAQLHLEEALVLARELGDRRELVAALTVLTQVHRFARNFDAAAQVCEQSLALAREEAEPVSLAVILMNRVMLALQRGSTEPVAPMLAEAHRIVEATGDTIFGLSLIDVAAGLAGARGEWARAARYFGAVQALAKALEFSRDPADESFLLPLIERSREALGPQAFADAETAGGALSYQEALADVGTWLASIG